MRVWTLDFSDLLSSVSWRLSNWAMVREDFSILRLDDIFTIGRIAIKGECLWWGR